MSIRAGLIALLLIVGTTGSALADMAPGPRAQGPGQKRNQQQQADADAAAAFAGGFLCIIGVICLIGIGIKIAIVWFIVVDAKKRGMDPTMWVILEIFVGIVGLIVYLCVREPLLSERRRRRDSYDRDDEYDDDQPRRSRRVKDKDDGKDPFDFG